jgi:hypothetical protein
MVSTSPPVLAADLNAGLKRLKMAAMRRLAPELLVTAKTQRWSPEEFLRTLVEAEIAARDASNAATRRRQAGFPVTKNLGRLRPDRLLRAAGHIRLSRFAGMDPRRRERVPDWTGRDREVTSVARLGSAAVDAGYRVRYPTAAELVDTLFTEAWPTTPSAKSSTPCSATI